MLSMGKRCSSLSAIFSSADSPAQTPLMRVLSLKLIIIIYDYLSPKLIGCFCLQCQCSRFMLSRWARFSVCAHKTFTLLLFICLANCLFFVFVACGV